MALPNTSTASADDNMTAVVAIREGLATDIIDEILARGVVSREQLHQLVIPRRTLDHRRKAGARLTPAESERALRVERVISHALDTFGDSERARSYMSKPMSRFRGLSCIEMLDTDIGARLVEDLLTRIDYGIYG